MWPVRRSLSAGTFLLAGAIGLAGPALADAGYQALVGGSVEQVRVQSAQVIEVPRRDTVIRRGETVTSRSRPELKALGGRVGTFLVFPSLGVREEYNDNIFATDDGEKSDLITRIQPGLRIDSDWANHALSLQGSGDIGRYIDNGDENFEDFQVGLSGRVDVQRSTNVRGRLRYQKSHEERGSPDDVNGAEPTEYDVFSANVRGLHNFGRINLTLGGSYRSLDFDDVPTSTGVIINNDDRDRDIFEGSLRVAYEIVPEYEAYIRGAYNFRDYDSDAGDPPPTPGLDRDSDGFDIVAGVEVDFGGLVFGDFFAGYKSQNYVNSRLDTVDQPTAGAEIIWNVTPLTTIIGSIERDIAETTFVDSSGRPSSGRFLTTGRLSADHELLRNLLIGVDAGVTHDDFEGTDRTDLLYVAGIDATYMMNRYLYISGGYTFRMRDADVSTEDYTENVFMIRLRAQY